MNLPRKSSTQKSTLLQQKPEKVIGKLPTESLRDAAEKLYQSGFAIPKETVGLMLANLGDIYEMIKDFLTKLFAPLIALSTPSTISSLAAWAKSGNFLALDI